MVGQGREIWALAYTRKKIGVAAARIRQARAGPRPRALARTAGRTFPERGREWASRAQLRFRAAPLRPVIWATLFGSWPLATGLQHEEVVPDGPHWLLAAHASLMLIGVEWLLLVRRKDLERGQARWRMRGARLVLEPVQDPGPGRDDPQQQSVRIVSCEDRLSELEGRVSALRDGMVAACNAAGMSMPNDRPPLTVVPLHRRTKMNA